MSAEFENLHQILRNLYTEMLPLCGDIIGVAKGVAGLGALFYIAAKVWQALARAEPIDVYPLLRPFAIGLCIMFFPTFVLGTINTVMSPVVKGCNNILQGQTLDIEKYSQQRDKLEYEAMVRNPETAYLVSDKEFDKRIKELGWSPKSMGTMLAMQVKKAGYEMKRSIWDAFRWVMELLFQAASLILDTIRTFFLIVLSILGPLAFAISRYIGIYLWLPVSDLFSAVLARIQLLMLQKDVAALEDPNFIPDMSNAAYIIFMLIGIIGYFTIPTVSSWIIQNGGAGSYSRQVNSAGMKGGKGVAALTGAAVGHTAGKLMNRGGSSKDSNESEGGYSPSGKKM